MLNWTWRSKKIKKDRRMTGYRWRWRWMRKTVRKKRRAKRRT
jgi:hypothetical protein